MINLDGKYSNAIIYTDNIEKEALSQVIELINTPAFVDANVRIMPDTHAGKGCVIGFTALMKIPGNIPSPSNFSISKSENILLMSSIS